MRRVSIMDLQTLTACRAVSICGIRDIPRVSSFLSNNGLVVLPWCDRVGALIAGDGRSGRWKLEVALVAGVPVIAEADLYTLPMAPVAVETDLWVDKYKPRGLKDVIGNADCILALQTWLKGWLASSVAGPSGPRGVLVSGPPGIGKTTSVHLVCAAAGFDVVEFNASDTRSALAIRSIFEVAGRSGFVGSRPRVVIMDEVDGMSSGDRGGVGELARLIRECTFPVIAIANERGGPRLRPLVSVCLDVRFSRPVKSTIAKVLATRVCAKEGVKIGVPDLEMLCERNGNDIRAILNFLQFSYGHGRTAGAKDELLRVDAFTAAGRLFGYHGDAVAGPKYNVLDTRVNLVFVDHGMVPLMIGEGYVSAAARGRGSDTDKLLACAAAADRMSTWELLDARIHRSQAWGLLPSAAMAVVGAAATARGPAPFQIFPRLLGQMSKRGKLRRAQADLRRRAGFGSEGDFLDMRGVLRAQLFTASGEATAICDTLEGMGLTRDDMFETLSETVFTGDEKTVAMDSKLKSAISREMGKRSVRSVRVAKDDDGGEMVAEEEDDDDDPYSLADLA
jgi:replication factor C subunit 1